LQASTRRTAWQCLANTVAGGHAANAAQVWRLLWPEGAAGVSLPLACLEAARSDSALPAILASLIYSCIRGEGVSAAGRAARLAGDAVVLPRLLSFATEQAGRAGGEEAADGSAAVERYGALRPDVMTLDLIDVARVKAETASIEAGTGPLVRPIRYMGGDYYVMFLHDFQVHDLRTNTATGQWQDIQKAAMAGGDVAENPIFTGALGIYNGVVLHKATRVTQGVNASNAAVSNTRRAVLCGAQSATIAFGADSGATRYTWVEELFDYQNQFGVSAGCIWGLKKTKFTPANDSTTNAEDFGAIVVSTYAAAPTGA
jgi:N4-gp56 family major capsid protein